MIDKNSKNVEIKALQLRNVALVERNKKIIVWSVVGISFFSFSAIISYLGMFLLFK